MAKTLMDRTISVKPTRQTCGARMMLCRVQIDIGRFDVARCEVPPEDMSLHPAGLKDQARPRSLAITQ